MWNHRIGTLSLAVLAISLGSCSTNGFRKDLSEDEEKSPSGTVLPSVLSRASAAARSHQVAHIAYGLWFSVEKESTDYEGRAMIRFDLKPKARDAGSELSIDFERGTIHLISVNGVQIKEPKAIASHFDGHHIKFSLSELQSGPNRIEVSFTHPFSINGEGFYRFKDPEDGNVYLYTDNEPYKAHQIFPCFDQPDLKASYELTVEAPKDWVVIANMADKETTNSEDRKTWIFPASPVLSTYLFAMIAGPYKMWKSDADGTPTRVFTRKSVAKYMEPGEWLNIIKRGLDFYNTEFGYPYPFGKMDQIVVPDFNAGAMENAGAITFSERYLFRTKVTQDQHRDRADTILHEMAHMWFGDLVTMKWWNGLWLNESFASFMSSLAVDNATKYKGAWQHFAADMKNWALGEDQLVTTHPIEVPVPDTATAESNFDGITYGKGASAIKQLRFLIGEEDFRDGVQRYFQKYAFRNSTTSEFIKMLSEASGRDLGPWQKSWLQTPGVNTVHVEWTCALPQPGQELAHSTGKHRKHSRATGPVINSFKILQGNAEMSTELRLHKTQVLLGKMRDGHLQKIEVLPVEYSQAETSVPDAIGLECPTLVYPNFEDDDYVKVSLDSKTTETVSENLSQIGDPFLVQLLWSTLFDMVVDGKLPAEKYIDIALKHLGKEKDSGALSSVLQTLYHPEHGNWFTAFQALPLPKREDYHTRIENFFKRRLELSSPGSDIQLEWYEAFLSTATLRSEAFLHGLLRGKSKISGIRIDQARRWDLIRALASMGASDAEGLISEETKHDSSDYGQNMTIAARASIPEINSKKLWWSKILRQTDDTKSWPPAKIREAMKSFNQTGQEHLTEEFVKPFFDSLKNLRQLSNNDEEYMYRYSAYLFPSLCSPEVIQAATSAIDHDSSELPIDVIRNIKVHRQWQERCVRARQLGSAP